MYLCKIQYITIPVQRQFCVIAVDILRRGIHRRIIGCQQSMTDIFLSDKYYNLLRGPMLNDTNLGEVRTIRRHFQILFVQLKQRVKVVKQDRQVSETLNNGTERWI